LFETKNVDGLFRVNPVINHSVRALCVRPYPGHKKGCPNAGKKEGCPPSAPLFDRHYDLDRPIYAVVNEFDLARHVARMKAKHPKWSLRQLVCCLYWQRGARKKLKVKIQESLLRLPREYEANACPEAMGVNITATLADIGIVLEWPPVQTVRQVALLGIKRRK
jgi:predicted metal-binding protein